ncbi:MAG TPA: acyl-CoA dehydrogenase family protein [Streptosporangiaceae bacterium]|nr:acyl-CoA dehydrogenase family protein [Streptosporangiaceae bacterium]
MSRPGGIDPDFAALVDEVFGDHAAAMGADAPLDAADPAFAGQLESLGLARLTTPESAGGSGATWLEAAAVLRAAARHGIAVPAVEEDLIGGGLNADARRLRGALMRAIQMTGAMDAAVELTARHTTERRQFGRPLAAFQAVQQLAADAAAEAALARAATDAALVQAMATQFAGDGLLFSIAVARSVCGHAGSTVVRNAHQVHGAIGTTIEHVLHRVTMPILAWANDFGSVAEWDALLEQAAREAGEAGLWELVSGTNPAAAAPS